MRIELIKESGEQYDITNVCQKYEWGGSYAGAARYVQFDYINAPFDSSVRLPEIATGDYLSLTDAAEGEVFFGQIFGIEKSSQTGTISYKAYDMMKHLLESNGQYNFKNITPEAVAAQVCADLQVPIRYLYPTGVNIGKMICDQMTMYDIILAGYTKAHKMTGDKYFAMIYKRGLGIYKSEWIVDNFLLSDSRNIYESSISESMEQIKNRVKIYDEKGNQIGEVSDDSSIKKFGVFQDVYKKEKDVDSTMAAKGMIQVNPEQSIKLSALDNINCLSHYFVTVQDAVTGLRGRYWISSDTHRYEAGNGKMELELRFDSLMDEKDAAEKEE